jgi:predicted lactoylglutathione lyase
MSRQVFINLPVADLPRAMAFFAALGFRHEPQFTNEQAACVVISEHIYAMLLTHGFFAGFTSKPIADATRSTEVLVCLSCDSRQEVDELVKRAVAAGGRAPRAPQDHGFMYGHGFEDPDGHIWELVYMRSAPQDAA